MKCPQCGYEIPDNAKFCEHCGTSILPDVLDEISSDETDSFQKSDNSVMHYTWNEQIDSADSGDFPQGDVKEKSRKWSMTSARKGLMIGLIIALVLIVGLAIFMLYRLGIFSSVSDEELLNVQPVSVYEEVEETEEFSISSTQVPYETPAVEEEAEEETEEIKEEQSIASEEPKETETALEEETEDLSIEVDRFECIGSDSVTLYSRGTTSTVEYVIEPEEAESEIVWSSSDETVAVVNSFGTIQARRGGSCTITGVAGNASISVSVICSFEVPDTLLDMNIEDITMHYEGETAYLFVDYELTEEQNAEIVWESSDPEVASVDESGIVTAVADGTAVITAAIGDYSAQCTIRCIEVTGNKGYNSADSVYQINYEDVTLSNKGEYFQLKLTSTEKVGNAPSFTWESSDPSVATVDSDGIVTAVSDGTAYITASVGEDLFRCIVRVHLS